MIRTKARYRNQTLELPHPLSVAEGTEVEVDIKLSSESEDVVREDWAEAGTTRLEAEWNNPQDAIYDDWKKLYGV